MKNGTKNYFQLSELQKRITNEDSLIDLEASAKVEIYSRSDVQDDTYTQAEAEASCGSKTHQLTREKPVENHAGCRPDS